MRPCTQGIVITVALRGNLVPDKAIIREALSGSLCRCTGYQSMVAASGVARLGRWIYERARPGQAERGLDGLSRPRGLPLPDRERSLHRLRRDAKSLPALSLRLGLQRQITVNPGSRRRDALRRAVFLGGSRVRRGTCMGSYPEPFDQVRELSGLLGQ